MTHGSLNSVTFAQIRREEEEQLRLEQEARERIRAGLRQDSAPVAAHDAIVMGAPGPISPEPAPVTHTPATVPAAQRVAQPWLLILLLAGLGHFAALLVFELITEATGWTNAFWLLRIADTLIGAAAIGASMSVAKAPKGDAAMTLAYVALGFNLLSALLLTGELGWVAWLDALFLSISSFGTAGMDKEEDAKVTESSGAAAKPS